MNRLCLVESVLLKYPNKTDNFYSRSMISVCISFPMYLVMMFRGCGIGTIFEYMDVTGY